MKNRYIINDIRDIKKLNREQKRLVYKYIIKTLIRSYVSFGSNHRVTQECLHIYHQFRYIMKTEENIFNIIKKSTNDINYTEFTNLIDKLDTLNDDTIMYIYNLLDNIDNACFLKQISPELKEKRNFKYIYETNDYYDEAIGLILNDENIKEFLDYPEDFWKYIDSRVRKVDSQGNIKNIMYETVMHFDKNNKLDDMRVFVPHIINLKTALINIHEFKHAYDLYLSLGMTIPEEIESYEESARAKEKEFVKEYLKKLH